MKIKLTRKEPILPSPLCALPDAIPLNLICKSTEDFWVRAKIISEWLGNSGPILCSSRFVKNVLNSKGICTESEKYRTIGLIAELDYEIDPIMKLLEVREKLDFNGILKIRCHPWCSRDGGHHFSNKAYIHLLYSKGILKPIQTYENWFKNTEFEIIEKKIYRHFIEDKIFNILGKRISELWGNCLAAIPHLKIEYCDYILKKKNE